MQLAGVKPGMWVADVGAGEGYYTVRLAPVGRAARPRPGRGYHSATPATGSPSGCSASGSTMSRCTLGKPDDPMLPRRSFDRIFLVHMYHEVQSPYAFLWNLREGLKPAGEVVVVDADRPTRRHGIPPALLTCEFAALGMQRVQMAMLAGGDAYLATFRIMSPRPKPSEIKPCTG